MCDITESYFGVKITDFRLEAEGSIVRRRFLFIGGAKSQDLIDWMNRIKQPFTY